MGSTSDSQIIRQVDDEIKNLYEYCRAAGLSHEEIVKKAQPLLQPIAREVLKKKCFAILKLAMLLLAFYAVCSSPHMRKSISMKSRQLLFQVLPFWDWTVLYDSSCVINNPFFQNDILEADCQVCEDLFQIDHLNKASVDEIEAFYLQNNIPVILSGEISDWPAMDDSFTIWNLTEGYLYSSDIKDEDICMFQTNLRVLNQRQLLQKIVLSEIREKWYSHWENCKKPSEKFLRKFYKRPNFLPATVQMTGPNWLFMSSDYTGVKYKMVPISSSISVMWFAQLRGYQQIRLEPWEPCEGICNVLEDIVQEGDLLLFNPTLWNLLYLPGEETENLAFAASGYSEYS